MPISYNDVPDAAPQPVMWKSLGQVVPGLWANYAIPAFGEELDVDREADLRQEIHGLVQLKLNNAMTIGDGDRFVRYAYGSWPELIVQLVMVTDEDRIALQAPARRRN